MTIKYLLTLLTPMTINLYGFPWAFMAWAFESIPYLRQQVNYQEEVFCPRILRWFLAKTDKNVKFLDLLNPSKEAIVHPWLVSTNRELKMPFFLTLWSRQTLSYLKIIEGIKMKLFGATAITRKIILEGGLVVVDDGSGSGSGSSSGSGSGSGVVVRDNDTLLTIFDIKIHYDYDHTDCTNFSPDFGTSSECSTCKCQDYKAKNDGVINAINALTASVKKMTSKRGVITSKRISYPYTPLEIKVAKRGKKDISKASSSIEKSKIPTPLPLYYTIVKCTRAIREQHELKKMNVYHLFQQTHRHISV
ncbi:hypothetical protein FXO38_03739, partial [Capsicum annuum]